MSYRSAYLHGTNSNTFACLCVRDSYFLVDKRENIRDFVRNFRSIQNFVDGSRYRRGCWV